MYVTCCFCLAAFNILSLCLVFVTLISVCLGVFPWVYPVWDSLSLLDLIDYFLFHVGEIFSYNLFKNFLIPFLFLLFFWGPYNLNVGAFAIVPEVSETILSFFHSFNSSSAAAKSLQSCPTLCSPIDGSPPGPTVPGILQARTLEWVAISSSNA